MCIDAVVNWSKRNFFAFPIIITLGVVIALIYFFITSTISSATLNQIEGFVSLIALLIAILVFFFDLHFKRIDHYKNQKELLTTVLIQIRYLGDGTEEKILGRPRKSHAKWLEEVTSKLKETNGFVPPHDILEINADFFSNALDSEFESKSTMELKKSLYFIRDKSRICNYFRTFLHSLMVAKETLPVDSQYVATRTVLESDLKVVLASLEKVSKEIQEICSDITQHINSEFGVSLKV